MTYLIITMFGGNCPVQAEGTYCGKPFYFRARGEHWSFRLGGDDPVCNPEWMYEKDWQHSSQLPFAAGWMTRPEAAACIMEAIDAFEEER